MRTKIEFKIFTFINLVGKIVKAFDRKEAEESPVADN